MNAQSIALLLVILAALVFALRGTRKSPGCCGGCDGCAHTCGKKKE